MYQVMNVLLAVFFNPAAGVDEGLEPGGCLIVAAGAGIAYLKEGIMIRLPIPLSMALSSPPA